MRFPFALVCCALANYCFADVRRVSESAPGIESDGESYYLSLSGNGRYVAFSSKASNLVTLPTGQARYRSQIYVKDLASGQVELISESNGRLASTASQAAVSADGNFVAFTAWAPNWFPDVTGHQVFLWNRLTDQISVVSVNSAGQPSNGWCMQPAISRDGRFISFASFATNMGTYVNAISIFLHDRVTGQTERISPFYVEGNEVRDCHRPTISDDGRFVAFEAYSGWFPTASRSILYHDRASGRTILASRLPNGHSIPESCHATISGDGSKVAFEAYSGVLLPNFQKGLSPTVFVRNMVTGEFDWVNVADTGPDNPVRHYPSISRDGRHVAFVDHRPLVQGDSNGIPDVYLRDLEKETTVRVSRGVLGEPDDRSFHTSISDDGSLVAFTSYASNLVTGDKNQVADIFVGAK